MATRQFFKMSGSGNDFVMFDARNEAPGALEDPVVIQALCARGTGVGADGVVFIQRPDADTRDAFRLRYYNADGSRAELCGNATLCATRLAAELGVANGDGMRLETDAGTLAARMVGALPEVDVPVVDQVSADAGIALEAGERRIGFAVVGNPHLVVRCDDVERVEVMRRGRALRLDPTRQPSGANVNFVSPGADGRWRIRTYERGVEGETLACGTGSVATAILLAVWGECGGQASFVTRSGRELLVTIRADGSRWRPSLRGEGRLVFTGELADR